MSRYHPDLVREIEAFTSAHDMPETTFGRRAMGDPHFMRDIRGERCLRPESVEKVRRFMEVYSQECAESSSGKSKDFAAPETGNPPPFPVHGSGGDALAPESEAA